MNETGERVASFQDVVNPLFSGTGFLYMPPEASVLRFKGVLILPATLGHPKGERTNKNDSQD